MQDRKTRWSRPAVVTAPPRTLTRRSVLAAGLGTAALAGCGGGESTSSANTLNVWGGVAAESGPADLIAAFEEAHPEYTVNYTWFINDDRGNLKLDTALQGGVDIDVYFTYPMESMALRTDSGMALDLTDRVQAEPGFEPFLDTTAPSAFWQNGRITALATIREPNLILINQAHLDAAGLQVPTAWTADEFVEVARTLTTERHYGCYALPDFPRIELGADYWYNSEGGSNFSHPAFIEQLTQSRSLIEEGILFPWTEVLARQLDVWQHNVFIGEEFSLWTTAPWTFHYLRDPEEYPHDFTVAAAPMPTLGPDSWNSGLFGNFIMINAKSTKQDLAWEFVKFWLTDGAIFLAPAGKMPTLPSVDDETMLTSLLGEDADEWFDVDSFRRVLFEAEPECVVDTNLTAYPDINLAWEQQRDVCWIGERSPEAAIDSVDSQAQAAIERFGGRD